MKKGRKLLNFAQVLVCKKQKAVNNNMVVNQYGFFINRIINSFISVKRCKKCENNSLLMSNIIFNDKRGYTEFSATICIYIIIKKFLLLIELKSQINQDMTIEHVIIILFRN